VVCLKITTRTARVLNRWSQNAWSVPWVSLGGSHRRTRHVNRISPHLLNLKGRQAVGFGGAPFDQMAGLLYRCSVSLLFGLRTEQDVRLSLYQADVRLTRCLAMEGCTDLEDRNCTLSHYSLPGSLHAFRLNTKPQGAPTDTKVECCRHWTRSSSRGQGTESWSRLVDVKKKKQCTVEGKV